MSRNGEPQACPTRRRRAVAWSPAVSLHAVHARWPHAIPITLIIGAVDVANALYFSGTLDPNPLHQLSGLAARLQPGWLPGRDTIDPNAGFTSQANGHRAV